MNVSFDGFDWDEGNQEKCRKHGVSVEEIEGLLGATSVIMPDVRHSQKEDRFLVIGKNHSGRYIFLGFTIRRRNGRWLVRPVTARYMHKKEVDYYEEKNSRI